MAREQHNEGEVEERRDNMTLDERIKVVGEQVALVKQLGPDKYLTVYPHQAEELLEYLTELAHRRAADERREAWQKRAVEVLRKVEWMKEIRRGHLEDRCNCCRGWKSHFDDCALAALLREVEDNG